MKLIANKWKVDLIKPGDLTPQFKINLFL